MILDKVKMNSTLTAQENAEKDIMAEIHTAQGQLLWACGITTPDKATRLMALSAPNFKSMSGQGLAALFEVELNQVDLVRMVVGLSSLLAARMVKARNDGDLPVNIMIEVVKAVCGYNLQMRGAFELLGKVTTDTHPGTIDGFARLATAGLVKQDKLPETPFVTTCQQVGLADWLIARFLNMGPIKTDVTAEDLVEELGTHWLIAQALIKIAQFVELYPAEQG